jgi:hypothetical protein
MDDSTRARVDQRAAERLAVPGLVRPVVWRAPQPPQSGSLSPQLSRLLLEDRTTVGDVVVDVDDDIAFAATAAQMGRRHHGLGGAQHLASMSPAAGDIDLLLVHWPRQPINPHWLLRACRALLSVGGSIVVAVSVDVDRRVAHLSALRGAAATARLHTTQHVAILAPPETPPAATRVAAPSTSPKRRRPPGHNPAAQPDDVGERDHVCTDLLILQAIETDDE